MKAVVAAFNQEKALVGAFSVITNLRMELLEALLNSVLCWGGRVMCAGNKTTNDRSVVPVNYADVGLMYWYLMMALLDTTQRISYFYIVMPRTISISAFNAESLGSNVVEMNATIL